MDSEASRNNRVLMYSIMFNLSFAVIALVLGTLTASQVILFDGIFTFISIVLTYLSMRAMKFIKKQDHWNYPFGKETLEPLVVGGQYCIILLISIVNIYKGVQVILTGGSQANIVSGILYGAFSTLFCLGAYIYLKHRAGMKVSAIAEVELNQWKISLIASVAVFVGFSVGSILALTPLHGYLVFVDPVLTILFTLFSIKIAVIEMRTCLRELLIATPSEDLTLAIKEKVNQINSEHQYKDVIVRLGKAGDQLVIEIDYVIEADSDLDSICMQDKLRQKIYKSLDEFPYDKWLNINFIGDIKWAL